MITALLVDDETGAVERMAELLERFPAVSVIGTACDVADARRFLGGRTPDVVFLDIDMPGGSGFELVPHIPAGTRVVFVTALEVGAIDAFRVGATDYLRKPVDIDRLAVTIDRLVGRPELSRPADAASPGGANPAHEADVTLAHVGSRVIETVPRTAIAWVEACRNYSRVQLPDRRPLLVRRPLGDWEGLLPEPEFCRLDRSLFVRVTAIKSTQWQSRYQTLLFFRGVADALPIGRAATMRLKDLLPR